MELIALTLFAVPARKPVVEVTLTTPVMALFAVTMAEVDDGLPPRPAGRVTPALISAFCD